MASTTGPPVPGALVAGQPQVTPPTTVGVGSPTAPKPEDTTGTKRKRRASGSGFDRVSGRRILKEYPLTEGDMRSLSRVGALATVAFSTSAGLLGFWINISKDLSFAQGVPEKVVTFWETVRLFAGIGCPVAFLSGCILLGIGHTEVNRIKRDTTHDE